MPLRILVKQGDITREDVDAIVNAANAQLAGGGGVDGAIHRAAGPQLMAYCDEIRVRQGGCPTGSAVITPAAKLPCRFVIHAVGPVWHGGSRGEDAQLASAYRTSLELAEKNQLQTIAFANISTGVYGFPKERAAKIVAETITIFQNQAKALHEIRFICHDTENYRLYTDLFSHRK